MKRLAARIITAAVIVLLLAGGFARPKPAAAGVSSWTAITIPSTANNQLGPSNVDIRDFAVGNDNLTLYAAPGDSVAPNVLYKSTNAGTTWITLTTLGAGIKADLVAVAPDDTNYVVVADTSSVTTYLSTDGGTTWNSLGVPSGISTLRSIAVSPLLSNKHYITVAGNNGIWYFQYWNISGTWQKFDTAADGFLPQSETASVAFSPAFASDGTLLAVTDNSTNIDLQIYSFINLKWNDSSAYTGFPCGIVSPASYSGVLSASITLSPTYYSLDENYRDLFIGLALNGDAADSGVYRFMDTVKANMLTGQYIRSVVFNGSNLLAGSYNSINIYRIQNPLAVTWTVTTYNSSKSPGGDNKVILAFIGTALAAGTSGNESAFSISQDYGATFTDISLIDTAIANTRDFALTTDAGKQYLVTDDNTDTSVWYSTGSGWTRVFCLKGHTGLFIRIERQYGARIYLVQKNTSTYYINTNSGAGQWYTYTCPLAIQDIAVESVNIMYALDSAGKVGKSTDGGISWGAAVDTTLGSGNMLYSISVGKLLAAGQNGYIAYSFDSDITWTVISQLFDVAAGKMQVIADQNFAINQTIYAASQTPGLYIKSWEIGVSTSWTNIKNTPVSGGIYGLAIDTNTLYALEYNSSTAQSTLWRCMNPIAATATSQSWVGIPVNSVAFNSEPQALKVSPSNLWAVNTAAPALYNFTDSVTGLTITLQQPAKGYTVNFNPLTGIAYDLLLSWQRPGIATAYEVDISTDPNFLQLLTTITVSTDSDPASVIIGPKQSGVYHLDFGTGWTYYWRVRVTQPGYSVYSETRYFTIGPLPVLPALFIQLNSPTNGSVVTDTTPSFSWQPLQGAEEYEFMLSTSPVMDQPLLDARVDSAGIHVLRKLDRGKTYYWHVRASRPLISDWSPVGSFMVSSQEPAAAPPSTPVTTPTYTVKIPVSTQTQLVLPPSVQTVKKTVPGYLGWGIFISLALIAVVFYYLFKKPKTAVAAGPVRRPAAQKQPPTAPIQKPSGTAAAPPVKPLSPQETPKAVLSPAPKPPPSSAPPPQAAAGPELDISKDAATVIFAARSFMWLSGSGPDEERNAMGKKLALRIRELSRKEPLYIRHPEDAALLYDIWARYGSYEETTRSLENSIKGRPENAVRLVKCFLPQRQTESATEELFNRDVYLALGRAVDPDEVYAVFTASSKFKLKASKEPSRVSPADSRLIARFMQVHLEEKKNG